MEKDVGTKIVFQTNDLDALPAEDTSATQTLVCGRCKLFETSIKSEMVQHLETHLGTSDKQVVVTQPIKYSAIEDPANIVILDETTDYGPSCWWSCWNCWFNDPTCGGCCDSKYVEEFADYRGYRADYSNRGAVDSGWISDRNEDSKGNNSCGDEDANSGD